MSWRTSGCGEPCGPSTRTRSVVGFVAAVGALVALGVLMSSGRPTVLFEGSSEFGAVRVVERRNGLRVLYMGAGRARQSAVFPGRPTHLELAYSRVAMVGLGLVPPDGRILFVGLGGGAMPTYVRHMLPEARIDVVEIDPLIVDVASRLFGFRPDSAMTVHTGDGRAFIEATPPGSWDLIVLDAFSDDEIPRALTTRGFLEAVRSSLAPQGVVVSNVHSSHPTYASMIATYGAVFPAVQLVRVGRRAQRIVVAAPGTRTLDRGTLLDASRELAGRVDLGFDLPRLVERGYERPTRSDAPVLEDGEAPDGARPRNVPATSETVT